MHVERFSCIWIHVNTCIAERTSARFARSGVDVVRLCGGMLGPKTHRTLCLGVWWAPKSTKLGSKIKKNPSSWALKSTKLGSKIKKNQSREVSGGVLGPSWPPRAPQDQNIPLNQKFLPPLGHPFWRPKPSQSRFFRVPRGVNFYVNFLIARRWIFFSILSPTCHLKPSQNTAK